MKIPQTDIICIIDRSGSMRAIQSDAIGGFNSFLAEQKALGGEALFTLVLFDHEYEVVHKRLPIELASPLDERTYRPRGTTALLDAVGRTIEDVAMRQEASGSGANSNVIVVILTDGLENASRDYTRARVAELVERQQKAAGWAFIFLAANQDAFAEAQSLNMPASAAMCFEADAAGVRGAYASMSDRVLAYRSR